MVNCFSTGDEFYNWVHDKDGYTIVRSQVDGFLYYANEDMSPSAYKVSTSNPTALGLKKWIKIPKNQYLAIRDEYIENDIKRTPTLGTVNNLNVFIRFADENEFSDDDIENNDGEGNEELISKQQNNQNAEQNKINGF